MKSPGFQCSAAQDLLLHDLCVFLFFSDLSSSANSAVLRHSQTNVSHHCLFCFTYYLTLTYWPFIFSSGCFQAPCSCPMFPQLSLPSTSSYPPCRSSPVPQAEVEVLRLLLTRWRYGFNRRWPRSPAHARSSIVLSVSALTSSYSSSFRLSSQQVEEGSTASVCLCESLLQLLEDAPAGLGILHLQDLGEPLDELQNWLELSRQLVRDAAPEQTLVAG